MDKILVIDADWKKQAYFKMLSKKSTFFTLIPVTGMEDAIAVLKKERIAVLLMNHFDNLEIDGLELLAYTSKNHPSLPCIVITSYGKPWFKDFHKKSAVYILKKPIDEESLTMAVFVALDMRNQNKVSDCMTVKSILPLIEIEQRTCGLTVVKGNNEKGFLYFDKGELIGAFCKNINGERAAYQIAGWNNVKIGFAELRRRRRYRPFKIDLMDLAGAEWRYDIGKTPPVKIKLQEAAERFPNDVEKQLQYSFFGEEPGAHDDTWKEKEAGGG